MSAGIEGESLDVLDPQDRARFEQLVLPHLDAAFNLSRWLLRGRADAEDVAQEATRASSAAFMVATPAPGFCRSCATPAIPGWRKIVPWT